MSRYQSQVDEDSESVISIDSDKEAFLDDKDNDTFYNLSKINGPKTDKNFSKQKTEKCPQAEHKVHSADYETRPKDKIVTKASHSYIQTRSTTFQKTRQSKPKHNTKPVICPKNPEITIKDRLYNACVMGKVDVVREIMSEHYLKWMPDEQGRTPLYIACLANQKEVVECLVEIGFDVNHQDNEGQTPLHIVFEHSLTDMAQLLRRFGAIYKLRDTRKWTPYHVALDNGYVNVSEKLLKKFLKQDLGTELSWLQLQAACHENKLETVQLLLEHKADVNHICSQGQSALYIACAENNTAIARLLIQHGADPNILCPRNGTALHLAVLAGNQELIESLLSCPNIDVNIANFQGDSCLHVAAYKQNAQALAVLLQHEADINKVNDNGQSLLHIAIKTHNDTIVKLLLQKGADPNQKDMQGRTSLLAAAWNKYASIVTLIDNGAELEAVDHVGRTALMLACSMPHDDAIQVLVKAGADTNVKDIDGEGCLHWLVHKVSSLQTLQLLIEHEADINATDSKGRSALYLACDRNRVPAEHVHELLKAGAHTKVDRPDGNSPLHLAVLNKNAAKVALLLQHGAACTCKNSKGHTPYDCALLKKNVEVIKLFEKHDASLVKGGVSMTEPVLHYHCKKGNADDVVALLKEGVDKDEVYKHETALEVALVNGHTDIVRILIDAGANVSTSASAYKLTFLARIYHQRHMRMELLEYMIKSPSCVMDLKHVNADGETIFFQACKDSVMDVISLLLYCKRDEIGVNVCNTYGKSPVAIASENARKPGNKSVCIVTMLMESKRKVDVNCVDCEGKTALHRACECDSIFIANMLCLADDGCKHINLYDSSGHTPLYYAKNPDLVNLLIKFGADPSKCD